MNDFYNNSFYNQKYSGIKVLVLVPHEDDEINLAGSMIVNFINLGAEVYVCFSTNGDYQISAEVRLKEAANSLVVLGCKKENIFFLGYGDTLNGSKFIQTSSELNRRLVVVKHMVVPVFLTMPVKREKDIVNIPNIIINVIYKS